MTMTLLFEEATEAAQATVPQNPVRRAFAAIVTALAGLQAAGARRIALSSLLEMDAHRLDDLGLNAQDVLDALNRR